MDRIDFHNLFQPPSGNDFDIRAFEDPLTYLDHASIGILHRMDEVFEAAPYAEIHVFELAEALGIDIFTMEDDVDRLLRALMIFVDGWQRDLWIELDRQVMPASEQEKLQRLRAWASRTKARQKERAAARGAPKVVH